MSCGTSLFVKPKDFLFVSPMITTTITEDEHQFKLTLTSKAFAKSVALDLLEVDCIFSDNYFDLSAGFEKGIYVDKATMSKPLTQDEFQQQLAVVSVMDIQ